MQYNVNNPSIKRILREVKEMEAEPSSQYHAAPLEENLFEWHFTIKGPAGTEFEGGLYHGRIILPPEYPFKPPNIVLLNPSGRFEVGTKICLSISSYHPEHWQPSWSIRTVLVALISFMPTKGEGAIGALDYPPEERRKLAAKTIDFSCDKCGAHMCNIFPPEPTPPTTPVEEETTTITSTTTTTTTTSATTTTTIDELPQEESSPAPTPDNSNANNSHNNNNNINNNNYFTNNNNVYNLGAAPHHNHNHNHDIPVQTTFLPQPQAAQAHQHHLPNVAPMIRAPVAPAIAPVEEQSVHGDTVMLDYVILAIVVAIVGLIVRKMYYSTDV